MNFYRFKAILFCIFCCFLVQTAAFAQNNVRITIKKKNLTLQEALQEVEKQSSYLVAFNESKLQKAKRIDVEINAEPLENALTTILAETGFTYHIKDKYILIVADEKNTGRQKLVKGIVSDAKGEPLIGVNVSVKGKATGVITNLNGEFMIEATKGEVLELSYIGYANQILTIADKDSYIITLQEDTKMLDEVVVTALGIKRQSKVLGYNLTEVKSDEITAAKDVNFVKSLAGKVAGLQINSSAGGVGAATKVTMRGAKSITKDNNVLYVIDGIPIFNTNSGGVGGMYERPGGESIADINPDDIASMSILTGPSAAALYGTNAANGAILITTKKGEAGKVKISLSHSTDFMKPFITPRFQNTYGSVPGEYKSWGSKLETPSDFDPLGFFRTGFNTTTSLSLSAGTEKNQSFVSAATTNAGGIMPNNEYNRYNFTIRNTTKVFNDKLTIDVGASYIKQDDQNPGTQGQYQNPLVPLYLFPRGEDFSKLRLYEYTNESRNIPVQNWPYGDGGLSFQNPYWIINRNLFLGNKDRYMVNASLKWDIIPGVNVAGRVRLDNEYGINEKKFYAGTAGKFAQKYGYYSSDKRQNKQTYADLIASLNKSFHGFDLTANIGTSISDQQYDSSSIYGQLKTTPNSFTINNIDLNATASGVSPNRWREQTQSVFVSAELGYQGMVYLSATGRNDWPSQLANTENKGFFYPSVGLSTIMTEIFNMPDWVTFLKLRGSYSRVGSPVPRNISIPTYPYTNGALQTITRYPISKLYPEMTDSYEAGFDLRLFQNRLNVNFTCYQSNTRKQTFNAPLSASTGYSSITVQTGNIRNRGLELSVGYNDEFFDGLHWDSQFTFSLNRNKIISLVDDYRNEVTGEQFDMNEIEKSATGTYLMMLVKGGSIGDIYTTSLMYTDHQGDIYIDEGGMFGSPVNGKFKVGCVDPKYNMGLRNSFSYKGIDLNFLISARVGGEVVSVTEAMLDNYGVSERSAISRDNGGIKVNNGLIDSKYYYEYVGGGVTGMISNYVYSATNIRLQELTLGYKLPKKWFNNALGVKVSLVGRNLWMIYNKAPFDPEMVSSTGTYYQGLDYFMLPSTRNIGFSIKLEY